MSQGFLTSPIAGYDDNGEGLDKKLCVHYYSRFKFFIELAPLLLAAKEAGEEARVVSVFAAGQGNDLDRDDVGMKKTYSTAKCGRQGLGNSTHILSITLHLFLRVPPFRSQPLRTTI
jgi:hypothetical protein